MINSYKNTNKILLFVVKLRRRRIQMKHKKKEHVILAFNINQQIMSKFWGYMLTDIQSKSCASKIMYSVTLLRGSVIMSCIFSK